MLELFVTAKSEISQLSLSTQLVLLAVLAVLFATIKFSVWISRLWGRGTLAQRIEATGMHTSVADHEVAMLEEVRDSLGIRKGQAVIIQWKSGGLEPLELKLKATDRYRRQGVFEVPNSLALSKRIYEQYSEHFGGDDQSVEVRIKSGWWPGDHPDPTIRLGFWITVWVTVITTIISLMIELFVP